MAQQQSASTVAAAEQTPPPTAAPSREPVRQKIVVVDEAAESRPTSLAAAAAAARAERYPAAAEPAPVRITNDNVAEFGRGVNVTFAGKPGTDLPADQPSPTTDGDDPAGATSTGATPAGAAGTASSPDESYWRERALALRQAWHDAVEETASLEQEIADLRWRFYAEDDPWVRDSQIKPAWDSALERQRDVTRRVHGYRQQVDELLEEGRRAGALPGWLRAGIELEPPAAGPDPADRNPAEPREPVVVDEHPQPHP